jgi:hypothetical protein
MKNLILTLSLITNIITLNAQIDTTLKEYFPLEIGNYWEYRDNLNNIWKIEVIKDTIMPNGKKYFVLKDSTDWVAGGVRYNLYRIDDSMRVWQYAGDNLPEPCESGILLFDLRIPDSTIWTYCISSNHPEPELNFPCLGWTLNRYYSTLNFNTVSKTFCGAVIDTLTGDTSYCGSFYYELYELAKGIGLARRAAEQGNQIFITGAIIGGVQYGTIVSVREDLGIKIWEYQLYPNYPNPFNPVTQIQFSVKQTGWVTVKVFDILSSEVAVLVNSTKEPGNYEVNFDASNQPSGIYIYTLQVNGFTDSKKMLLLK